MPNFCAQCGSEVSEQFRFCPNCGAEIPFSPEDKNVEKNQSIDETQSSHDEVKIIICDNCGEENPSSEITCISCGVSLKKGGTVVSKKKQKSEPGKTESLPSNKNTVNKKSTPNKKKTQPAGQIKKEKEIDSKKIILIISLVAVLAIVILVSAGVFDSGVPVSTNTNFGNTQNQEQGIDLTNIKLINELEAKLKSNPDDKETLLKLAHLQNDSGFYEKAIQLYQKYLVMVPDDADARIDMGVCYYNLHNYDSAIKEIKTALTYKPDHQIGNLNLGIVNLAAGNMKEAMKWLQKAVDLGPETEIGNRAKELLNSHIQK